MADKKPKEEITEKTEEIKEEVVVKEPKVEEKVETKNEKTEETDTQKDEVATEEKSEDKTEDKSETKGEKTEETNKNDGVDEAKKEEKSDVVAPEKKSLKDKVLSKKEKGKENDGEKEVVADENKDGYVSAREVVNTLDKDVKIVEKSEDEILANHVAEQLRENQDYFIFRIRKSLALMLAGLTVILLWMIPLSSFFKNKFSLDSIFSKNASVEQVESPTASPEEVKKLNIDRIRIKIEKETEKVASISSLLKNSGYTEIDIQEAEVEEDGITVAVKKGNDELREKLMMILKDEYNAGSSSSELTSDSDFSAVILIGK